MQYIRGNIIYRNDVGRGYIMCCHCGSLLQPGFTKPVGTGPVWPVIGQIGPDRFRFGPVPNWSKFKIQIWIQKNEKNYKKFLKILQGATNLMVSNFLKNLFI